MERSIRYIPSLPLGNPVYMVSLLTPGSFAFGVGHRGLRLLRSLRERSWGCSFGRLTSVNRLIRTRGTGAGSS